MATARSTPSAPSTAASLVALAPADGVGRGGDHRAATTGPLGERLLHAQGPAGRLVPRRLDAARAVRRAAARARGRRPRARLRPPRAVRGARRVPPAGALARQVRPRRPPRRAGATEDEARGRRAV